jgi:hypothetical protein
MLTADEIALLSILGKVVNVVHFSDAIADTVVVFSLGASF